METKMDEGEFNQLLAEINAGTSASKKDVNKYLIFKEEQTQGFAIYELRFPQGVLEDDQPRRLAEALLDDVSRNPRYSIFEHADLPKGYGLEASSNTMNTIKGLVDETKQLDPPREEIKKFSNRSRSSLFAGLSFLAGAIVAGPIAAPVLIALGLASGFPPLLLGVMVALAAIAVVVFGVAAYSKWQEKQAKNQFDSLYRGLETSRDSLKDSLETSFRKGKSIGGPEPEQVTPSEPKAGHGHTPPVLTPGEGKSEDKKEPESTEIPLSIPTLGSTKEKED